MNNFVDELLRRNFVYSMCKMRILLPNIVYFSSALYVLLAFTITKNEYLINGIFY